MKKEIFFTDENGKVVAICHQPTTLDEATKSKGYEFDVSTLPLPPEVGFGEDAVRYIVDGQLEWRIEPRSLTIEEQMEKIDEKLNQMNELYEKLNGLIDQKDV